MAKTNWAILTTRFGRDIESPTRKDLDLALQELVLTDDEHPNTWLRVEDVEGKMHLVNVYRPNQICYLIYADQDAVDAEQSYELRPCTVDEALQLWTFLQEGEFKKVQNWFSHSGPQALD